MIRHAEITEAETPVSKSGKLDLSDIVADYRYTVTQTYAGCDGAGEALYETKITDVEVLCMILKFGTHPVKDAVVLMPSELAENRRQDIEAKIQRAIERGL